SVTVMKGSASTAGELNIRNLTDPNLRLHLIAKDIHLPIGTGQHVVADASLNLNGSASIAYVDGGIRLDSAAFTTPPDAGSWLDPDSPIDATALLPQLRVNRAPFNRWRFSIDVTSAQSLQV